MSSDLYPVGTRRGDDAGSCARVPVYSAKRKRCRILCCVTPTATVETSKNEEPYTHNDFSKSTVCMDYHILSRIEDDVKRAEMRLENPDSAIPDRGYPYAQGLYGAAERYHAIQLPPFGGHLLADNIQTAITPRSTRPNRGSRANSRHTSRPGSSSHTPTTVQRSRTPGRNRNGRQTPGVGHLPQLRYPNGDRMVPVDSARRAPTLLRDDDYRERSSEAAGAGILYRRERIY
ncbi:hypothetical protein JKF63_07189 [Porcisia hertigi]|uniref:Uncharacterized protein n=1 Tax=Porcisia hertigi TaxID=2761500 RepID=A0A836YHN4_9TRYP|nr:hypothetical protein JKF63_07189 [Porcisia hertigi]